MSARKRKDRTKRRREESKRARNRRRRGGLLLGAGLTVGGTLGAPAAAEADTIAVTNLFGDGSAGTLGDAVADAEASPDFDRILFNAGLSGDLNLEIGDIDIDYPVEIVGPGAEKVTINADTDNRIFDFDAGVGFASATITGLTLSGGSPDGDGGAIRTDGTDLTILDSVITGNTAEDAGGGIIAEDDVDLHIGSSIVSGNTAGSGGGGVYGVYGGSMSINASTISGNLAERGGGVVSVYGVNTVITNSTISGNETDGDGGGISFYESDMTVANTTISGNIAEDGAGIEAVNPDDDESPLPKLTVRNSTITGNMADDDGGGIQADGFPNVFLLNAIVAGNTAAGDGPNFDATDQPIEAGFSLIDDEDGATIVETTLGSNVIGLDPELGSLADNGGPTFTHALSETSPALDAGNGTGATHDQRGAERPVDQPTIADSAAAGADRSDIGAFELEEISEPPPPASGGGSVAGALGGALECRGEPATMVAAPGVPTIGTSGRDVIVGTTGADEIRGRGGKDLICASEGDDRVFGGGGNDTILGHRGNDLLRGQGGRDRLGGGLGEDRMLGGTGRDGLNGGPDDDELFGGSGRDRISGKQGRDLMRGNRGPDRLFGGPDGDRFDGGTGRNILHLVRGEGDEVVGKPNSQQLVLFSGRARR